MHTFPHAFRNTFLASFAVAALICGAGAATSAGAQEKTAAQQSSAAASSTTASAAAGQQAAKPEASRPAAKPEDVSSPDAILAATYDVISGPPGARDWNRFYSLFMPDARLIATGYSKKDGKQRVQSITPEGYAKQAGDYFLKNGFFEREIGRKSERYSNIMQIFSTYESRNTKDDKDPFARGINSFQLYYDGTRWWVVTIFWEEESPTTPLPKEFLSTP
jgi:hypothetical protein